MMAGARVILGRAGNGAGWGRSPYGPAEAFPELQPGIAGDNALYGAVRSVVAGLGLDVAGEAEGGVEVGVGGVVHWGSG